MKPASLKTDAPSRTVLFLILSLMATVVPTALDMYLPALPAMERDLHASVADGQLTLATFFVGMSIGQLFYGRTSDKFGRRPVSLAGAGLYIAASLGCVLAPNVLGVAAFRLLQAIGACGAAVIARAVIFDIYDAREGARYLSRMMLIQGLAPILAPVAGGWLAAAAGWRAIFLLQASMGALIAIGTFFFLPETRSARAHAASQAESTLQSYLAVVTNRPLMLAALAGSLGSASFFTYLSNASQLLIGTYGVPAHDFGYYFAANAIGYVACAQINRALLSRFEPRKILDRAIPTTFTIALALLAVSTIHGLTLWGLLAPIFLLVGSFAFLLPNALAIAQSHDRLRTGAVAAVTGAVSFLAGAASATLSSALFDGTATPMALVICCTTASALILRIAARNDPSAPTNPH